MKTEYVMQISMRKETYDQMTHQELSDLEEKVGTKYFRGVDQYACSWCGGLATGKIPVSPIHTRDGEEDYAIFSFGVTAEASRQDIRSAKDLKAHYEKKLESIKGLEGIAAHKITATDFPMDKSILKTDPDQTEYWMRAGWIIDSL